MVPKMVFRSTLMLKLLCTIVSLWPSLVVGTIYRLNATEYSRMPALYSLDEYSVCMEQPQAVYCLVKLDLHAKSGNPLMHTIHEYSMDINRHYNHTNVDRGVCVRTSCRQFLAGRELTDDRQLDEVLQQCMNDTVQRQYGLSARLAFKFNCDRAGERDEITFADWSFLAVAAALVLAVIGATIYDQYLEDNRKDQGNQYILSFSVVRNFNWLFNSDVKDDRMNNFKGLHGTRFVVNLLMISAHSGFIFMGGFQRNTHDVERTYDNSGGYLFYNGLVIVQIFFFISGFLLAYNIEIYSETKDVTMKFIPLIMFKRFMRLSPGLGMMIWFTSTWLRHLGSGPLWKLHTTNSVVADCQKYWWSHMLYVNNYVPDNRNCAIQTWHIAADTQMFLLALVLLIATRKASRGYYYALIVLLLLGTLAPAINVWLYNLDALILLKPEFWRTVINDTFFYYHIFGHNNLQSYVVGMAIARLVYQYQLQGKDFSKSIWYARSHIFVIPAIAYYFYSAHVFYAESIPILWRAVYAAVQRLIMAILTTWLILGFVLKVPSYLRNVAEHRVWLLPSRLTYSVYLVHLNIIHIWLGSRRSTSDINVLTLLLMYIGVTVLAYLIALLFYLIVEAPFTSVAKVLTSRLEENYIVNDTKTIDNESSKNKAKKNE